MTDLNAIKPELVEAQNQVEMQRNRLDEKLEQIQNRIEASRKGLMKITERARTLEKRSERDPLAMLGVFLMTGFLLGRIITRDRLNRSEAPHENPVHGTSGARMPEPPSPQSAKLA